ncbi:MAG TPA: hypothetical protein VFZ42_01445 [Chitinophagaceae bacterium]
MKKILLIMFLTIGIGTSAVFASDNEEVTPGAKRTFEKEFPSAQYAKWEKISNSDVYMVRFVYNNQALLSYIDEKGDMVATARNVYKEQLPFMINQTLDKKLSGFKVIQLEELTTATETSYFATLENDKSINYVRVLNNGSFSVIKKMKK